MDREEVDFRCYKGRGIEGYTEILFLFYPNGVSDGDIMLKHEALEKYPLAKYKWVLID